MQPRHAFKPNFGIQGDLNLLDQRVKLARSKLKVTAPPLALFRHTRSQVAQRELDQYQNKGAPLPLPVATANSKQEIAQAITGLVESATDVRTYLDGSDLTI